MSCSLELWPVNFCCLKIISVSQRQWSSIFLIFQPLNIVPHIVVPPTIKFSLIIYNCIFLLLWMICKYLICRISDMPTLWKGHLTPKGILIHRLRTSVLEQGSSRYWTSISIPSALGKRFSYYIPPWAHQSRKHKRKETPLGFKRPLSSSDSCWQLRTTVLRDRVEPSGRRTNGCGSQARD